ncbi:MAG TPA: LPS assembly lipoprotein LptE [Nitrospira sp.]|nr:LPS assembly lipoprotein LptE [Nitrospira sp.]
MQSTAFTFDRREDQGSWFRSFSTGEPRPRESRLSRTAAVLGPSAIVMMGLALCACGYQFRVEGAGPTIGGSQLATASTQPPPRLIIKTFQNRSFEPNLDIKLTNYIRHEFASGSGATVVPESEGADLVLTGQILAVIIPTLSFLQTQTLESRTEVVVAVQVEETRTKRVLWKQMAMGASEFFVTQDLQFNRVLQNRALEQAGRYVAEDLASRFLVQLEAGKLAKPVSTGTPAAPSDSTK